MVSTKDITKEAKERQVIQSIAAARGWLTDLGLIFRGEAAKKEPDFFYFGRNEKVAFEVTEICDQEIAHSSSVALESGKITEFQRTHGVAKLILEKKLNKKYEYIADCPIELVCFFNARTFETDQQIVDQIFSLILELKVKFNKVWYHGLEDVYEFYNDGSPPRNHGPYPSGFT